MALPIQYSGQPFQQAADSYGQAANYAIPSMQSRDRAAARVRSRTDAARVAGDQQIADQYQRRGMGGSGAYYGALDRNRAASQSAYATGLADMETGFSDQEQKGADIFSQIGAGYTDMGKAQAEMDLGQQKLNVDRDSVENDRRQGLSQNIINAILAIAQGGNTDIGSNVFRDLFESLGLQLGNSLR